MGRPHCLAVVGTRPEAIKMAPVLLGLQAYSEEIRTTLVLTAQHREILDQALQQFGLRADIDLNLMKDRQSLPSFTAHALTELARVLQNTKPDFLLVQGDTTTVFAASLAAFYEGVSVGHVEAGLRTHDMRSPFPEEINRRLASALADLHFAPTAEARENLIREHVDPARILLTGNPVIDALRMIAEEASRAALKQFSLLANGLRTILLTSHRRENHGEPLRNICRAVISLTRKHADIQFLWPLHPNPEVYTIVRAEIGRQQRIHLVEPMDYHTFVGAMALSTVVLTDSGGVQEEAPALGKPVLVLRDTTERPEGVQAGVAKLVGTEASTILEETTKLLTHEAYYRQMTRAVCPYGDGRASERIVAAVRGRLTGRVLLSAEKPMTRATDQNEGQMASPSVC